MNSYLKLAWVPRTQPALDRNPYVHEDLKWELDRLTKKAEELLARGPVMELFDKAKRESKYTVKYTGESYIAYSVDTGEEATEILKWWREHGYRSIKFSDESFFNSRNYTMVSRVDKNAPSWTIYMYFDEGTCTYEDVLDENGKRVVERVIEPQPEVVLYKRQLNCGDSQMPEADGLEGSK